jgi:hypothetical protein
LGARRVTRENQKAVLGRVFNFRLGCFSYHECILLHTNVRQHTELKTRPRLRPVT